MELKFLSLILLFLLSLTVVNGVEINKDKYLIYNNFMIYDDLKTNKVSYSIKVDEDVQYDFIMRYYYEGEFVDKCEKEILLKEGEVFKKIICDVQKLGNGEYVFDAVLANSEDDDLYTSFDKTYLFNNMKTSMNFEVLEDQTKISIYIEGKGEDIILEQEIPKSVIQNLNKQNQDDLINSKKEYTIIEEDPLIAWNVERVPSKVNYTINKKITNEDKKKFRASISENKGLNSLKYLFSALILIILIILFKPIVTKKNKK